MIHRTFPLVLLIASTTGLSAAGSAGPWDLNQLNQPPKFEWLDSEALVRSLLYEGEPYGGKPTRVFAYYATPGTLAGDASKDKSLPAVVLIHGGGGTAFREWAELWARRGYAAIAMDLAGHRPDDGKNPHQRENRTRLPDGGPDQGDAEKFGSIDKAPGEQWPYHAIAAVIRAHSLIRSFKEVDPERTAATGISWGGYLTCIVAGVDRRFKAAVPVYGCGFLHENSAWLDRFAKMTPAQRERWIELWDPSQYLPSVSMPILFVNGTNDFAYPLDSYMKSFDAVPAVKQIRVTVNMPHGHPPGWAPAEIGLFIDHHLLGKPALPTVGTPQVVDGQVRVTYKSPTKLTKAELHLTKDDAAINKRQWTTLPAKLSDGLITADSPPTDSTAWFVTVEDERGASVSSRVMLQSLEKRASVERRRYRQTTIEGWTTHVSERLLAEQPAATQKALDLLSGQLRQIVEVVPMGPLLELQNVPLWLSPSYEGFGPTAEYHPDAGWLRKHGRDPAMSKAVEFTNIAIFEAECRRMPMLVLHELAHGYHDRVLGFDHAEIAAAWQQAVESKSYDAVKRFDGRTAKAYAMTNAKEYFAECSEAFFGRNDFFPFVRAELKEHDPRIFELLARLWRLEERIAALK